VIQLGPKLLKQYELQEEQNIQASPRSQNHFAQPTITPVFGLRRPSSRSFRVRRAILGLQRAGQSARIRRRGTRRSRKGAWGPSLSYGWPRVAWHRHRLGRTHFLRCQRVAACRLLIMGNPPRPAGLAGTTFATVHPSKVDEYHRERNPEIHEYVTACESFHAAHHNNPSP
jgi:hypothetical protein